MIDRTTEYKYTHYGEISRAKREKSELTEERIAGLTDMNDRKIRTNEYSIFIPKLDIILKFASLKNCRYIESRYGRDELLHRSQRTRL